MSCYLCSQLHSSCSIRPIHNAYIHLTEVLSRKLNALFCKIVFLSQFLTDFPGLLFIQFQIKRQNCSERCVTSLLHLHPVQKHTYLPCITLVCESACSFIEEALTLSVASNQHIIGLASSLYILSRLTLVYGWGSTKNHWLQCSSWWLLAINKGVLKPTSSVKPLMHASHLIRYWSWRVWSVHK